MIKELRPVVCQEVLSMASNITYSIVPDWYDGTYRDLKMHLIIPKHRQAHPPQPCILFLCGGAYAVVNGSIWLPEMMDFAREGYTVATIEYRTSNHDPFPAQLIDAKSAVRFLKAHAEQFCIDPHRIVAAGESAGGTLCSLLGVTAGLKQYDQGDYLEYDSSVAAVVDFYGPVNMAETAVETPGNGVVQSWAIKAFLGDAHDPDITRQASALTYVTPAAPPFMILHGTQDAIVNIQTQSDLLYQSLQENHVYVEYLRLTGADHGADAFYQPEIKREILAFLKKVLP